ncbi:hypothetical protein HG535_0F05510 [Zygotorulaspora mrakii]|uniref:TIGR01456 family HAD hydrolase n=1 Tax=Zygotorulaspora mrakii TaxID=42260 RepID=A0A7H9B7T0_ZYGMR|nr:uncharacterized protein HG535_0F05510 [Zygotorulaspora mrakii]QLG74039.1 hypothetical protein HG535_0F05510 [Zygotorulaspora mrakii]
MLFKRFLQHSAKKIGFAFDIDGVLLRSKNPIAGAGEALRTLNKNKIPYILLTNGGGQLEEERAAFISKVLEVPISPLQVVLSHSPYKALVGKYDRILAVGTPSVRRVAKHYGFKDVVHLSDIVRYNRDITPFSGLSDKQLLEYSEDIPDIDRKRFDAVLVFNDPHDWAADIQIISDALNSEDGMLNTLRKETSCKPSIPIYFSNRDFLWANNYSLNRFGQGAFRSLVRQLYCEMNNKLPLEDFTIGKPTKLTYDFAHHILIDWNQKLVTGNIEGEKQDLPTLGVEPEQSPFDEVFMVGDNPASDIIGAQEYGWKSCLVRTGVYKDDTSRLGSVKPTMIVDNVYEAVKSVLESNRVTE